MQIGFYGLGLQAPLHNFCKLLLFTLLLDLSFPVNIRTDFLSFYKIQCHMNLSMIVIKVNGYLPWEERTGVTLTGIHEENWFRHTVRIHIFLSFFFVFEYVYIIILCFIASSKVAFNVLFKAWTLSIPFDSIGFFVSLVLKYSKCFREM